MLAAYVFHRRHGTSMWHRCLQGAELSRKGWIARLTPRFSAEESAILDEFPKLRVTYSMLIIGDCHRLRDVAGLYLGDPYKPAEIFLDLARTPGKIEPFDWQCGSFHRCYLPHFKIDLFPMPNG